MTTVSQRWIVLEPGVVLGAVPPCGRGVDVAPPDVPPMPEGVLPPGAGVVGAPVPPV